MNPTDREQFRLALLRYLDEDGSLRFGLPSLRLHARARSEAFDVDLKATDLELDYLREKGLVTELPKTLSPENRAWKLTANGRDFLAQAQAR